MANTAHPAFPQPEDENVRCWRYLDLPKLLSMLTRQELHCTRLDKLQDQLEGTLPSSMTKSMRNDLLEYVDSPMGWPLVAQLLEYMVSTMQQLRAGASGSTESAESENTTLLVIDRMFPIFIMARGIAIAQYEKKVGRRIDAPRGNDESDEEAKGREFFCKTSKPEFVFGSILFAMVHKRAPKNMDEVIEFLKQRYPQSNAPDAKIVIENYLSALASQTAFARRHLFVNCWHLGELESEAMWRIYCREGIGVAVVLPYANLRDSLPNVDTNIGKVSYIQYDVEHITTIFDLAHGFSFAMHKRKEFSHESEARIVVERPDPTPDSIKIPWAPEDHIAKLVISPYSSPWYADTVVDVVKRISPRLADRVCQSSM